MNRMILTLALVAIVAMPALANKPVIETQGGLDRIECGLQNVCWEWMGEYYTETCDTGGASVWQYGASNNPEVPTVDCNGDPLGDVLATVLNGDYVNDAGERAVFEPMITVDETCYLAEFCYFFDIEGNYDGFNVEFIVNGDPVVIEPMGGGYTDAQLSTSTSYYAWCVDLQPGYSGHDYPGFFKDCYDLSAFDGQSGYLAIKFGSDSSVTYPGVYVASVVVGGLETPAESTNWSTIKKLY